MKYRAQRAGLAIAMLLWVGVARGEGDPQAGQAQFNRLCQGCHKVGPGARAAFGPPLNDLFGRQAGRTEGYVYSEAMKNTQVVWNDATLAAFINDPDEVVPGTKMRFWGLGNAQKIADLLSYLREQKSAPAP